MNRSIRMRFRHTPFQCTVALGLLLGLAGCGGMASPGSAGGAELSRDAGVAEPSTQPAPSAAGATGEPATNGDVDACALAAAEDTTALLGAVAGSGQPSSEGRWGCMWSSPNNRSVTLLVWTSARLEREAQGFDAGAYYRQSSALIGTPWEVTPEPVAGVGEQAVWAGMLVSEDYGTQGTLAALSGDAYFQFTTIGPERDAVATFAATVVSNYADRQQP